jgi:hypothetical protein
MLYGDDVGCRTTRHTLRKVGTIVGRFVTAASELGAPIEVQPLDLVRLSGDALRLYIVCKESAG